MTILIISDLHFEKGYHNETYQGDSLKWLNDIIDIHKPTALVGDTDGHTMIGSPLLRN